MKAVGLEELYKELENISLSAADRAQTAEELHMVSKYMRANTFKLAAQRRSIRQSSFETRMVN